MLNRIELWDPEKWQAYVDESQQNYSEIAENIAELNF
jgi:DNA-binding transcriptional regulator/RsmH inhibitor MraZ